MGAAELAEKGPSPIRGAPPQRALPALPGRLRARTCYVFCITLSRGVWGSVGFDEHGLFAELPQGEAFPRLQCRCERNCASSSCKQAQPPPSCSQGLRVLLVDCDSSRPTVQAQLQQPELQYAGARGRGQRPSVRQRPAGMKGKQGGPSLAAGLQPLAASAKSSTHLPKYLAVTAVSSAAQALGFLRTGVAAFDVVLADVSSELVLGWAARGPQSPPISGSHTGRGASAAYLPLRCCRNLWHPLARGRAAPNPAKLAPTLPRPRCSLAWWPPTRRWAAPS